MFYVYTLHDPRDFGHVIYVGKGSGNRAINFRSRNKHVREFIAEHGEPFFDIAAAQMTEELALMLEAALIAKHGRIGIDEGGTLFNIATGGQPGRPNLSEIEAVEAADKRRIYMRDLMRRKRESEKVVTR